MRSAEQRSYQPSTSIRLSPTRLAQRPRSGSSGRLPPHGRALGSDSSPSSGADFSRSSSHHIPFSFLATISCATVTDDFHIAKVSFRSDDSIFGLSRWVSIFLFLPPQDDWIAQIFLLWRKQGHGLAIPFNRVTFYWRPVNGWRAPVACGWVMVFSSVGATRISYCPLPRQVVGSFFFFGHKSWLNWVGIQSGRLHWSERHRQLGTSVMDPVDLPDDSVTVDYLASSAGGRHIFVDIK